jgi:hypothetical protein
MFAYDSSQQSTGPAQQATDFGRRKARRRAAPIPVSSGRTDRHRLHRGGDRDASSALWRVALVRMRCHQPTRDYVARRITEGKTKTEIMRCLKRYIAREAFVLLAGKPATRLSERPLRSGT